MITDRTKWHTAANDRNTDMTLVLQEMCKGSQEAFDLFYCRFVPLVMRIALKLLEDRMEAEDLCHDVLLEALRKGTQYDPAKGSVEAWLAVMTRSRCLDRLRRRSRMTVSDWEAEPKLERELAAATPEEFVLGRMERMAVRDALEELPAVQRRAVVTAYYGDKSQREMAKEWQVPLGTVKSWVRYGLNNLRKELAKRGLTSTEQRSESYD